MDLVIFFFGVGYLLSFALNSQIKLFIFFEPHLPHLVEAVLMALHDPAGAGIVWLVLWFLRTNYLFAGRHTRFSSTLYAESIRFLIYRCLRKLDQ